jgi:hypothetical protein
VSGFRNFKVKSRKQTRSISSENQNVGGCQDCNLSIDFVDGAKRAKWFTGSTVEGFEQLVA